jgi:hypothetical protein
MSAHEVPGDDVQACLEEPASRRQAGRARQVLCSWLGHTAASTRARSTYAVPGRSANVRLAFPRQRAAAHAVDGLTLRCPRSADRLSQLQEAR